MVIPYKYVYFFSILLTKFSLIMNTKSLTSILIFVLLYHSTSIGQILLQPISGADGEFTRVTIDTQTVLRSNSFNGSHAPYMYFTSQATVVNKTVYVEVKYLDYGTGRIGIEYNGPTSAYTNANEGFITLLTDSRSIKTAVFKLNDANFKKAQNLGADLRIWSEPTIQKHIISATLYLTPSFLWLEYDENWNSIYTGRKYEGPDKVDATTFTGKVICGYQGWFRAPGDLSNQGWVHYFRDNTVKNVTVDLWPDMSEYTESEKYLVPGWRYKDSSKVYVFSSANKKTVLRHFQWMQAYGIQGAAVQRFVGGIDPLKPYKEYNRIPAYVREAANRTGRVFYIEYDQSGVVGQDLINRIRSDWKYMVDSLKITSDNRYLHHKGKPVVGLYGLYPERFSSDLAHQVLDIFTAKGYEAFVMGSGEIFWHDAAPPGWTPSWLSVYQRLGAYSPWNVGHYDGPNKLTQNVATNTWKSDKELLEKSGVIFMPLIFPGFTWDNLMKLPPGTSNTPRRKGELMWKQIETAKKLGVESMFIAMFDEIDEGTAIFKVTNETPVNNYFATLEGLPSDYYLLMAGRATSLITSNTSLPVQMPNFSPLSQPSIPDILRPLHSDTTAPAFTVRWSPSTHTSPILKYQLEIDGKIIDTITKPEYYIQLKKGIHSIRVRAMNQLTNFGGWSELNTFYASEVVTATKENEIKQNTQVNVYPNPTNGTFMINFLNNNGSKPYSISIYNMYGIKVWNGISSGDTRNEIILDKNVITSGVYNLVLKNMDHMLTKKIIVTGQ